MSEIDRLNSLFGIDPFLQFCAGPGGLTIAKMSSPQGTSTIALHGGHVLEYTPTDQQPVLWLSKKAVFSSGKAIRGGIPVCWPWFGPHPENPEFPAHGIARTSAWEVIATANDGSDRISLTLLLRSDQSLNSDCSDWPHPFELTIEITLAESLRVALTAHNTGELPMTCSAALHSYFAISNIANIRITGLEGTAYRDQLDADQIKKDDQPITIEAEFDRVYHDTQSTCVITDSSWNRAIHVAKSGSQSTVVWNPWIEKAKRMADFGDQEYLEMVCVETSNADSDAVTISPGESHTLTADLSATTDA
ncbi:MAG: glucose-6-phosphate 1-epimerase [Verrucomicrobiales bacterium]|jgi:glucose-6-phosphate 1-epimerase